MATAGAKVVDCKLVEVRNLKLKEGGVLGHCQPITEPTPKSSYRGILVTGDMIMVADYYACNVRLHKLQNGILLATHRLEGEPRGISLINEMEICVILYNGQIVILSVHCTGNRGTISPVRKLRVQGGLDYFDGIMQFKDNVVVCGLHQNTINWCIVSLNDGHVVDTIHGIGKGCGGNWCYLATKDNMIYISCQSRHQHITGVYGYDIERPREPKLIYKHKELQAAAGIAVDTKGFIFVCNNISIHILSDKFELVSIYKQDILRQAESIFWEQHSGLMYVTSSKKLIISTLKPAYDGLIQRHPVLHHCDASEVLVNQYIQEHHHASEDIVRDDRKQPLIEEKPRQIGHEIVNKGRPSEKTDLISSVKDAWTFEADKQGNDDTSAAAISTSTQTTQPATASNMLLPTRTSNITPSGGILVAEKSKTSAIISNAAATSESTSSLTKEPILAASSNNLASSSLLTTTIQTTPEISLQTLNTAITTTTPASVTTSNINVSPYDTTTADLQNEDVVLKAIINNDHIVAEMIRNLNIPKQSIMEAAMKQNRYSKGVLQALMEMSMLLKKHIFDAVGVFCGYRPNAPHIPVFVVTLKDQKCMLKKEEVPEPFINYTVIPRYKYVPNDEEKSIVEQYGIKSVRSEDVAKVNNIIAAHTESLMRKHSNLSIIRPCHIKASGYTRRKIEVIKDSCIVFYVPVKGIIPVGEHEFPKEIDGIATDVREGEFLLFGEHNAKVYHPKLRIGCCISRCKIGTLGGFVDLPGEKIGCLTAAHVVLANDEIEKYNLKGDEDKRKVNYRLKEGEGLIEMHQPQALKDQKAFGKVLTIALEAGNVFTPSVDAALIEITDDDRKPDLGNFPDGVFKYDGLTKENPLLYSSGEIVSDTDIHQRERKVIKFGCTTGLTDGYLHTSESSAREVDVWGNYCFPVMFKQFEVSNQEHEFGAEGDSGALVFLCVGGNIRDLRAVGMLIGGTTAGGSCCVITPIKAVFKSLGITSNRFKVFPANQMSQIIERVNAQEKANSDQNEVLNVLSGKIDYIECKTKSLEHEHSSQNEILNRLSEKIDSIEEKIRRVDTLDEKINSLEVNMNKLDQNMKEGFRNNADKMIEIMNNLCIRLATK